MPSPPRQLGGRRSRSASCAPSFLPRSASDEDSNAPHDSKRRRASEGCIRAAPTKATRRRSDDEEWSPSSRHARAGTRALQAKRRRIQKQETRLHDGRSVIGLEPSTISDSSSASSDVECGSIDDSPLRLPQPPSYSVSAGSPAAGGDWKAAPGGRKATRARRSPGPWQPHGRSESVEPPSKRVSCSRHPQLVPSQSPPGGREPNHGSHRGKGLRQVRRLPARANPEKTSVVAEGGAPGPGAGGRGSKKSPNGLMHEEKSRGEESESYSSSSWGSNGNSSSPEREDSRVRSRSSRRYGERWQAEDGSKRHSCREWDCPRRAHFGTPGWVPAHCEEHRRDWEVFLKYASCLGEGCEERPAYGVPGDRSRVYCRRHRVPGSVTLASAGWKIPEGSRFVGGAGGWVEAEEDGMGVPVDPEAEVDIEDADAGNAPKDKAASGTNAKATKPSIKATAAAKESCSASTLTASAGVNAEGEGPKERETAPDVVSSGNGTKADRKGASPVEACPTRCEAKLVNGQKTMDPKPSVRTMSSGLVVLEKNKLRAEKRRARAMIQGESEGKTEDEEEGGGDVTSSGSNDVDDEDDDEFGEEGQGEDDDDSMSEDGNDMDEHVFAPGRFVFLVPSKKCSRPILVGKIVKAATASPASAPPRSSTPPPPVIPVSSATALLLAQAAALGAAPARAPAPAPASSVSESPSPPVNEDKRWIHVHWHTPASLRRGDYCRELSMRLVSTKFQSAKLYRACDRSRDQGGRQCLCFLKQAIGFAPFTRGPFTPDFVKKEWSKSGGWAPFVTKMRKSSVTVTCPGLLASRCIPADVLKELGV